MELITWVGINHYVEEERLEETYDSIHANDIVDLVLEPQNEWDPKAVAVFHDFEMRGHISRYETEHVHLLAENNQELIGRVTGEIDRELHRIEIAVENPEKHKPCVASYPKLSPHRLGLDINPFLVHEEKSYELIQQRVKEYMMVIKTSNPTSDLVNATVPLIIKAANRMLSTELKIEN